MAKTTLKAPLSFRVELALKRQLKRHAKQHGLSLGATTRALLQEALNAHAALDAIVPEPEGRAS